MLNVDDCVAVLATPPVQKSGPGFPGVHGGEAATSMRRRYSPIQRMV